MDLWSWDAARLVNAGLSAVVVTLMVMGLVRYWTEMPKRIQRIGPWVAFTYIVIAYSSATLAAEPGEVPPGLRVPLMMVNLSGLIISLLWNFNQAYSEDDRPSSTMKPKGPISD